MALVKPIKKMTNHYILLLHELKPHVIRIIITKVAGEMIVNQPKDGFVNTIHLYELVSIRHALQAIGREQNTSSTK